VEANWNFNKVPPCPAHQMSHSGLHFGSSQRFFDDLLKQSTWEIRRAS